jgi:hypothetical protein
MRRRLIRIVKEEADSDSEGGGRRVEASDAKGSRIRIVKEQIKGLFI